MEAEWAKNVKKLMIHNPYLRNSLSLSLLALRTDGSRTIENIYLGASEEDSKLVYRALHTRWRRPTLGRAVSSRPLLLHTRGELRQSPRSKHGPTPSCKTGQWQLRWVVTAIRELSLVVLRPQPRRPIRCSSPVTMPSRISLRVLLFPTTEIRLLATSSN